MSNFPLLSVLGIEIEYMLVDENSLNIRPISDQILRASAAEDRTARPDNQSRQPNETTLPSGDINISNELVLHVLEFKNNGPRTPSLALVDQFQQAIGSMQGLLHQHQVRLLPSGAHPWMDPATETKRWPHDNQEIYQQYDRIFDCRGHGWANLQSMHINLPYSNEAEFVRLHNAIRLILPLLPALAASSPILDSQVNGWQDRRLFYYGSNQSRIPSISGDIIPEFVQGFADYKQRILQPMMRAIQPFDPEGILQHPWLNSRGAIAKFEMQAIEIRILDTQESVTADIAIALLVQALLQSLTESTDYLDRPCPTANLKAVYQQTIRDGMAVLVDDRLLAEQWHLPARSLRVDEIWTHWIERVSSRLAQPIQQALEFTLSQGNLSQRLLKACRGDLSRPRLTAIYRQLADCLQHNQRFAP